MFRIDPNKLPPGGVRARCAVCGAIIGVQPEVASPGPGAAATRPGGAPTEETPNAPADDAGRHDVLAADGSTAEGRASDGATSEVPTTVEPGRSAAPDSNQAPTPDPVSAPSVEAEHRPAAEQPRVAPRRVNPFLTTDPAQRARRLARALVSDLVAYQPEKREEGLRAGTLKELFRDDIRRSWQEYVEQVGAPLAESTPHFQDALNDILAGGRRVF